MSDPRDRGIAEPRSSAEVVTLPSELDIHNSKHAETWLLEALEKQPAVVIADMSLTQFCDSSGIRCLIAANRRAAGEGAELRVVIPSPAVRRVMHLVGADEILRLYRDVAAAVTGNVAPDRASS